MSLLKEISITELSNLRTGCYFINNRLRSESAVRRSRSPDGQGGASHRRG